MADDVVDPAGGSWHLDKRVPVAIILTLLLQFAGIVWFASQLSARVDVLERALLSAPADRERLVRVETTVVAIDRRLERMEERR